MMAINSGTTDSSMLNSDNLDALARLIGEGQISTSDAIGSLCEQANSIMQPAAGNASPAFHTITP